MGFVPEKSGNRSAYRGYGLFNIREQLDGFKGKLGIESAPNHGSLFTIIVSLTKKATD